MMASSTRQWYGGPNFQMIKRGSTGRKGGSHSGMKGESPIGTKKPQGQLEPRSES